MNETGADRADIFAEVAERAEQLLLMGSALSDTVATLALFAMLAFDSGFEVAVLGAVAMAVGFLCRLGYVFAYKHSRRRKDQALVKTAY